MSGGYGGAKKMLWLMANYADALSAERKLGIRFQTLVPRQMVGGTGIGEGAAGAYAAKHGITLEQFLERFGAPMPPRQFGEHVVSILTDPAYEKDRAFGVKGDTGIAVLEGAAA